MKLLAFATAALLALPLTAMAKSDTASSSKTIAALVKRYAELDMFSGTVLVADHGKILYADAYGEANKDHRIPNRLNTSYNIGVRPRYAKK